MARAVIASARETRRSPRPPLSALQRIDCSPIAYTDTNSAEWTSQQMPQASLAGKSRIVEHNSKTDRRPLLLAEMGMIAAITVQQYSGLLCRSMHTHK